MRRIVVVRDSRSCFKSFNRSTIAFERRIHAVSNKRALFTGLSTLNCFQIFQRKIQSEEYLKERLGVLLAPKIAQKVLFGRVSTQIDNDRDSTNASDLATKMVKSFGFSPTVGQVNFTDDNMYSDGTKRNIDLERQNVMNAAIAAAEELLLQNKEKLQEVVDLLIREEVLHAPDLERILGPKRKRKHESSTEEDSSN